MEYKKAYKSLADSIVSNATTPKPRSTGLGSPTKKFRTRAADLQSNYMEMVRSIFPEDEYVRTPEPKKETELDPTKGLQERYIETEEGSFVRRPQAREDIAPEEIKNDPEFQKVLGRLKERFGIQEEELYRLIQGESGFKLDAKNPSGAVGLFQFIPKVLAEMGYTPEDVMAMEAPEQLQVYEQYLDKWNYNGKVPLSIVHAAPAFAGASDDTVVYRRGTPEWEQNPPWRPADGGDITVASIENYYRNRK